MTTKQIKTAKGRRLFEKRQPQLVENVKRSLFVKGAKTSEIGKEILKNFHQLKKPHSILFQKNNQLRPFEDASSLEFWSKQNDISLFVTASHTKKRPHNITFGRLFNHQLLDLFEFGVDPKTFKTTKEFTSGRKGIVRPGSKPMFTFQGDAFEDNPVFAQFRLFIVDFFRGDVIEKINLAGIDHVISCTAVDDRIYFRQYAIVFKKSGNRTPNVQLEEVGPRMNLIYRRHQPADEELMKQAMKQPRAISKKKRKNIETGTLNDRMGRVHMQKQDLNELALHKMKAFKKNKKPKIAKETEN